MAIGDEILVIEKEKLFKEGYFNGFKSINEKDYIPLILNNFSYRIRTPELETDGSWQQPIPYVWIINRKNNTVFIYKRASTGNEQRLHQKISGGIGGHIDKKTEQNENNPIISAMMRELKEEVTMKEYPTPEIIGFLKLEGGVEEVHFGIIAVADTEENVIPAEDIDSAKFYSIEEADNIMSSNEYDKERWTIASWPYIKEILLQNT